MMKHGCWLICCALVALAQPQCFRWQLPPGLQAVYRVEAFDTVALEGEPPLYRYRLELWSLQCEARWGDTMKLTQTLERFWAREHTDGGDSSLRTTLPLVGKPSRLVVTTRGWRLQVKGPSVEEFSVVPGGAFGPVFLVPLDSADCITCGSPQWLIERRDTLVEYAYPPAMMERLYLASLDSCSRDDASLTLSYAETSRGVHRVQTADFSLQTAVWLLAHGVVEIDRQCSLPKHISCAYQMRVMVERSSGSRQRGTIHSTLHAQLDWIRVPSKP
ncbi:MAG: hypothetical protein RML15_06625 [Bacteroidota bacterium]|nr:hypothetical protein [Candidatus Kapabacteria bacterium]MCS7303222.1 hypothetical protein [Candidatus Kapabacteria bacterium]MCX7937204.1 hypothetical protein [Chlorobiota bacterium]MDW8075711.1 hypothetical protein [Bacteroidota bacterium]MDW8272067.1 hypothetical protein [Bacteroidota bacterium]